MKANKHTQAIPAETLQQAKAKIAEAASQPNNPGGCAFNWNFSASKQNSPASE